MPDSRDQRDALVNQYSTDLAEHLKRQFAGRPFRARELRRAIEAWIDQQAKRDGCDLVPWTADEQSAFAQLAMLQFMPVGRPDLRAICARLSDGFLDHLLETAGAPRENSSPLVRLLWLELNRRKGWVGDWSFEWTDDRHGHTIVTPPDPNIALIAACGCRSRLLRSDSGERSRINMAARIDCPEHRLGSPFERYKALVADVIEFLVRARAWNSPPVAASA